MNNIKTVIEQKKDELTKANLKADSSAIINSVKEGLLNPLDVFLQAKYLNELTKSILEGIKDETLNEIDLYTAKDRTKYGIEFSRRAGYEKLNYEVDTEYLVLKTKLKAREALLKNARVLQKQNIITVAEDEGDVIVAPPVQSYISDSIIIKFKNE